MKNKRYLKKLLVIALLSMEASAEAALVNRGNGLIYDTVLDVTWLQDANFANTQQYTTSQGRDVSATQGRMTWNEVVEWTGQLDYAGFSNWRLPDVKPVNGSFFQYDVSFDGSTDFGEYITSPQSELSYMYFVNLQNTSVHDMAGNLILCGLNDNCLTNTGEFDNLQSFNYWSGVEVEIDPDFAWSFNTQHGIQTLYDGKSNQFHAWAVHEGDIAVVPLPAAFWLFLPSIFGIGVLNKSVYKIST